MLQALVERSAQAVLGEASAVDQPLMAAGLDSIGAQELQQGLSTALGLNDLPATLIFDHPTIAALAKHLHALVTGGTNGQAVAESATTSMPRRVWHGGPAAAVLGVSGACSLLASFILAAFTSAAHGLDGCMSWFLIAAAKAPPTMPCNAFWLSKAWQ